MIVRDNFKLMRITATQKITHYPVNFVLIHKFFALLVFNGYLVSEKHFQAIALVAVLVGEAKNCKRFFIDIFLNSYELQLLE